MLLMDEKKWVLYTDNVDPLSIDTCPLPYIFVRMVDQQFIYWFISGLRAARS